MTTDDLTAAVARLRNCTDGDAPDLYVGDLRLVLSALESAQQAAASHPGSGRAETAPAAGIKPGPLDHQNGVQRHEASAGCALGASSLESGNAREATCLNGEHDARRCSPTQQGQLGTNAGSIPAAPTDHIADLCKRLRKWYDKERGCVWEAAAALERLARENAIVQRGRMDLRAELSGERDRHKRTQERAERAEAERDVWKGKAEMRGREGCEARAERDALRECVRAADAMRLHSLMLLGRPDGYADYDRARAKVPLP